MFKSIKLRMVIWTLVIFTVVFTGLEVFLYYKLEDVAISLVDEHLSSEIHILANLLSVEDKQMGHLEIELLELSQAEQGEYSKALSGQYFQIVSSDGRILARSPSLALANVSMPFVKVGLEAEYDEIIGPNNEPLRVIAQGFDFSIGRLIFQAGDSLENTYKVLGSFRNIIIVIYPVIFFICAIGIFILTGWALGSLNTFSSKVSQVTEENLSDRIGERGIVTELKPLAGSFNTMLERLEASFAKQRQFLSDASHELRTPASIIKSFCDVTLTRERNVNEYKAALGKIGSAVNRMNEIINRILVISRLDSKTIRFSPVRMGIKEILISVIKLLDITAVAKGVQLSLNGPEINMRGDKEGLIEVFTNVVENAVKYNKPGGRVEVTMAREGERVLVTVTDTGIGMSAKEIEKVFDRFYRVDTSREVTSGSGLGLSIVRTIVESYGGRITVDSVQGEGSAFTVDLPVEPKIESENA